MKKVGNCCLKESSIRLLTAVTTAVYQRGTHFDGEALKFRTKAIPGVRKKILETPNSVFDLIGNVSLRCFVLFCFCFSLDIICQRKTVYICPQHGDKLFRLMGVGINT